MVDGPPQATYSTGNRFFRTFRDTFFSNSSRASITRLPIRSEEAEKAQSIRELTDQDGPQVSPSFRDNEEDVENVPSPLTIDPSSRKSKSRKKKGIISSSTAVPRVEICTGKKCKAKGSEQLLSAFEASSSGRVEIAHTTCMKACKKGMNVRVTKDGTTFDMHNDVGAPDCQQILSKHFEW